MTLPYRTALAIALLATAVLTPTVLAQQYPNKPIRLLIPSPPGGGTDILGRILKEGLTDLWLQPVVVDNRGGASGRIAAAAVAKAAHAVGFGVGIIDDREAFANAQRFPMAQEIFTSYGEAFEKLQPGPTSYLVIVTRGHKDDMLVLAWAVRLRGRFRRFPFVAACLPVLPFARAPVRPRPLR